MITSCLAFALNSQGKYDETEKMGRQGWRSMIPSQGANHLAALHCMHKLSTILEVQRWYQEAENMIRECLGLRTFSLGETHPQKLESVISLGSILNALDK
jgi:hypothetical protein